MAGVRIPPYEFTVAPTPPPDIDVEAWLDSLDTLAAWNPQTLGLTHFGQVDRRGRAPAPVRLSLVDSAERRAHEGRGDASSRAWRSSCIDATDPATVEAFEQAAPPNQLYMGLERYWRKKAERDRHRDASSCRAPAARGAGWATTGA